MLASVDLKEGVSISVPATSSTLAMLLQLTWPTRQVLLPLTATSRTHRHRLTARSAAAVTGARLALPFNHHTMRVKWLDSARACRRAGALRVHMACTAVLRPAPGPVPPATPHQLAPQDYA